MDHADLKLKIRNNSDHDIAIFVNLDYPDTSLVTAEYIGYIDSAGIHQTELVNLTWDSVFKRVDRITLFIVKDTDNNRYFTTGHNRSELTILIKKSYKQEQLDLINWTIDYP